MTQSVTRHTRANRLSQQHDAIDHETRKSWHFTTKADIGFFWRHFFELRTETAAHRKSFYGGRRLRSRLFLSQINRFASEDLEHEYFLNK